VRAAAFRDSLSKARDFFKQGQYADAEALSRRLVARAEAAAGADSFQVADALDVLVTCLLRGGKVDPSSRQLAQRALTIRERAFGPDHPDVARSLNNLANVLGSTGDYAGARRLQERALAILEKALGPDHPDVAKSLNNLGRLLMATGDYAGARPLYERALAIKEKALGPDDPDVAASLNSLALLLYETGDYAGARPLYERALAIKEKALGPDHPDVARSVGNLANLLWSSGDYPRARPLFERSLAIHEKALGPEHPDVARSLSNLANLLLSTGDYAGARPLYERALAIDEKALGPDNPDVAQCLNNLAELLRDSADYAGARPLYERALAIWEKALGPDHPNVAECLNNLAELIRDSGDYVGARPLQERALAILEKALGPDHPDVAESLNNLALLLWDTGDFAGARPLLERALAIRLKVLGPDHPDVAITLSNLAEVDLALGRPAAALDAALRAEDIGREHLRLTCQTLPERQALRYASVRASGLDVALSLASDGLDPESLRRVWDALLRSRSFVLDEVASRHRQVSEITRCSKEFASASERLANLMVRGPGQDSPEKYRRLLDGARQEREQNERRLAESCSGFRQEQAANRMGIADVARALPAGSALVAFACYDRKPGPGQEAAKTKVQTTASRGRSRPPGSSETPSYLALVLPAGDGEPDAVAIGPASEIDPLVARWQTEAERPPQLSGAKHENPEGAYRTAGEALRKRIWDPIAARVRGAQRAFIVPDGGLNLVNFAALPAGGSGYLLESGPTHHYLSAERDLMPSESEPPHTRGLLAVGGPAFDQSPFVAGGIPADRAADAYRGERSSCDDFHSVHFGPLPATVREAEEVAALWGVVGGAGRAEAMRLTGAAATETAFKKYAPGRSVLHLATHGFLLGGRCPSALDRTRGIGGLASADLSEPPRVTGDNPLLLSGLALAGANRREQASPGQDDGILTAEEIAALDLSAVEWAVLSACETGIGEVKAGEGVFGLRRAFQVAGAKTLIMSLWAVEDESARQWMKKLYQGRLLKRLGTAEAVREASIEVLRERRAKGESTHPFYWGAFVAAGDWR